MLSRLLFFSRNLALPHHHGGCVYPHALLTELHRAGVAIDYAWLAAPLHRRRLVMRTPLAVPFIARGFVRGTRRLGRFLIPGSVSTLTQNADCGPYVEPLVPSKAEQDFAAGLIHRLRPILVVIDGTYSLGILDRVPADERRRFRAAVLTHNLNHRRTDLYRQWGQPFDFPPVTKDEETAQLGRADLIVAIQDREATEFRTMCPDRDVVTIPLPVRPRPLAPEREIPGRCLFVGGYSGHNLHALQWLVTEVWPKIRQARPDAQLDVVGTVASALTSPPAGVRAVGPMERLDEAYAEASVCLVPLPMGTGLKIKLIEAMAYGRAVVTTPAGAEGFADVERGEAALVADGAAAFAAAVIGLLDDDAARTRVRERQLAWIDLRAAPSTVVRPLLAV